MKTKFYKFWIVAVTLLFAATQANAVTYYYTGSGAPNKAASWKTDTNGDGIGDGTVAPNLSDKTSVYIVSAGVTTEAMASTTSWTGGTVEIYGTMVFTSNLQAASTTVIVKNKGALTCSATSKVGASGMVLNVEEGGIVTTGGNLQSNVDIICNGTITATGNSANAIKNINGSGTIKIGHNLTLNDGGTVAASTFLQCGGGTVIYGPSIGSNVTLLSSYYNLTIDDSGSKTVTAATGGTNVLGTLAKNGKTIGGTVTEDSSSCGPACVPPTITLGADPSITQGATSASFTYSATTDSPTQYSIAWNAAAKAAGLVDVAWATLPASPISITVPAGINPATYNGTLKVRSSATCESDANNISLTVIEPDCDPINKTFSVTGSTTICKIGGSPVVIELGGSQVGVSYQLYDGTNTEGSAVLGTGSEISFAAVNPTTTTTYTVKGKGISGTFCTAEIALGTATITVNDPTISAAGGATKVDIAKTLQLSAVTAGGSWSVTSGGSFASVSASGLVTGEGKGTAVITYNLGNGCSATYSISVEMPAIDPVVYVWKTGVTSCSGAAVTANKTSDSKITISGDGVYSNNSSLNINAQGKYIQFEAVSPYIITEICFNGKIQSASIDYSFDKGVNTTTLTSTNTGGDVSYAIPSIPAGATSLRLIYTENTSSGLWLRNMTVKLAIPTCTAPEITGGQATVCVGSTATTAFATTAGEGEWSTSNTAIATIDQNGIVTGVKAGTVDVIYTVTGEESCPGIKSITVTGAPTITAQPEGDVTYGIGATATVLSVTATGATSYQWYINDVAAGTNSTQSVSTTAGGTFVYKCDVTNSCGTTTSETATITVSSTYPLTTTIAPSAAAGNIPAIAGDYVPGLPVTLTNGTANRGFTWDGWYYQGSKIVTEFNMPNAATQLTATYDVQTTSAIAVANKTEGIATVSVSNSNVAYNDYYAGETAVFVATLEANYSFLGWFDGETKVSGDLTYNHTVAGAITLEARAKENLGKPTNISASTCSNNATISWTAATGNPDGYKVEVCKSASGTQTLMTLADFTVAVAGVEPATLLQGDGTLVKTTAQASTRVKTGTKDLRGGTVTIVYTKTAGSTQLKLNDDQNNSSPSIISLNNGTNVTQSIELSAATGTDYLCFRLDGATGITIHSLTVTKTGSAPVCINSVDNPTKVAISGTTATITGLDPATKYTYTVTSTRGTETAAATEEEFTTKAATTLEADDENPVSIAAGRQFELNFNYTGNTQPVFAWNNGVNGPSVAQNHSGTTTKTLTVTGTFDKAADLGAYAYTVTLDACTTPVTSSIEVTTATPALTGLFIKWSKATIDEDNKTIAVTLAPNVSGFGSHTDIETYLATSEDATVKFAGTTLANAGTIENNWGVGGNETKESYAAFHACNGNPCTSGYGLGQVDATPIAVTVTSSLTGLTTTYAMTITTDADENPTGVNQPTANDKTIAKTEYFNVLGAKVDKDYDSVVIKRVVYTDGSVDVVKQFKSKK